MMKAITWLAAVSLGVAGLTSSAFATSLEGWSTDVDAAIAQAKKENKAVLVEFTGSDWCPPCIMMRKNVFSKKEFVDAASKNYVLVEVDVPQKDKALAARNQIVAEKYSIEGFPTVILLNGDGKEFSRFFAAEHPKLEDFLATLDKKLESRKLD
jgi:thiol:disulfide interchange protein